MDINNFFDIGVEPYYENKEHSIKLFHGDCLQLLPQFLCNSIDMIFADPPYFLSNGGITCHAGRMVSVNKGKWDISHGVEENHKFNLAWLLVVGWLYSPKYKQKEYKMKCPKCGSSNVDKLDTDLEDEETYGCLDCNCWFTIHSEPFTALVEELKYETITHDLN